MKTERNPVDVAFGASLRRLRVARRMSLADLASAVGVTYQQVQKYENGANRVAISTASRLAEALGVRLSDLVAPLDDRAPDASPPLSAGALRLAGLVDRLPTDFQTRLEDLVESVIDTARASNPQGRDVQRSLSH